MYGLTTDYELLWVLGWIGRPDVIWFHRKQGKTTALPKQNNRRPRAYQPQARDIGGWILDSLR